MKRDRFRIAWTAALHLLAAVLAPRIASADEPLPILAAHSSVVDVRDGGRLLAGYWHVDSTTALDTYRARRSARAKTVTFISDVDSLSVHVAPGRTYDFVIRLDGRTDCRTRISTVMQPFRRVAGDSASGPATIPISVRHGKLHVQGRINGSQELDLIFDTGADINVLYPSAKRKGATFQLDGTIANVGTGGTTLRRTSGDNQLDVAGLRWEHEPLLYIEKQADLADGIVGYPVFQDQVVEIDYDRMVMTIRDSLPNVTDYIRTPMQYEGTLTTVEADLVHGESRAHGWFILDTGGTGTLMVHEPFAIAHGLGALKKLGSSRSRGVGAGAVRNEVVLLPELELAGVALRNLAIHLEAGPAAAAPSVGGTLCMEVLERFNTILDYAHDQAYFKPNTHTGVPFPIPRFGLPQPALLAILAAAIATFAALLLLGRKRRRDG